MDFEIRQDPDSLGSTGFVEVSSGRYTGNHWQHGSIFIWEDSFTAAEGILRSHLPDYDHFAMNDVPRDAGLRAVQGWKDAASKLPNCTLQQAFELLHLQDWQLDYLKEELENQRPAISRMLLGLAERMSAYYQEEEWACVLGV